MTVTANAANRWEYVGDGSNPTFAYTSKIFAASDLDVFVAGIEVTTGFSVTGVGEDSGGDVVFDTPPANLAEVTVVRNLPDEQPSALPLGGPFPSTTVEQMVDKLQIQIQQLESRLDRVLRYRDQDQGAPSGQLPAVSTLEGKFLTFDADGAPVIATTVDLGDALTTNDPITWAALQTLLGNLRLESDSSSGSTAVPILRLARTKTAAADDLNGRVPFAGKNSVGTEVDYASIEGQTADATATAEYGRWRVRLRVAGSDKLAAQFGSGYVFQFRSNADSSVAGPIVTAWRQREGGTAQDNDFGGIFRHRMLDDAGTEIDALEYAVQLLDASAGTVDTLGILRALINGAKTDCLRFGPGVAIGASAAVPSSAGTINAQVYQKDGLPFVVGHLIDETTITTNTAAYTVTWDNTKGYKKIEVLVSRLRPAADDVLTLRTSTDGGSNYDSGAGNYAWEFTWAAASVRSNSDTEIQLSGSLSVESTNGNSLSGTIEIVDPSNASSNTGLVGMFSFFESGGSHVAGGIAGQRLAEADVDGVRIAFAAQNIAEAQFRVIGYF